MTAQYEKLDFAAFKRKLAAGEYKNLAGARRGIGRMSAWSEEDKDKARAMAERHFGEPGAVSAKKAPEKRAKKVAKKRAAKAASEPKASGKKAPKMAIKKIRQKQTAGAHSSSVMEQISEADKQIKTIGGALSEMNKAKDLGAPNEKVREGAKIAQQGLIQAVNNLCRLTGSASVAWADVPNGNGSSNPAWDRAVDATAGHVAPMMAPATPEATDEG